jgi:hypothetical protein
MCRRSVPRGTVQASGRGRGRCASAYKDIASRALWASVVMFS